MNSLFYETTPSIRENWDLVRHMSSFESFFNGEPSLFNIDAVEDSNLTLIKKEDFRKLISIFPEINDYTSKILVERLSHC